MSSILLNHIKKSYVYIYIYTNICVFYLLNTCFLRYRNNISQCGKKPLKTFKYECGLGRRLWRMLFPGSNSRFLYHYPCPCKQWIFRQGSRLSHITQNSLFHTKISLANCKHVFSLSLSLILSLSLFRLDAWTLFSPARSVGFAPRRVSYSSYFQLEVSAIAEYRRRIADASRERASHVDWSQKHGDGLASTSIGIYDQIWQYLRSITL